MFFYSLIGPSLMFFDAAMLGPRDLSVERIDVPAHFLGIRQVFLSVFMITILLGLTLLNFLVSEREEDE